MAIRTMPITTLVLCCVYRKDGYMPDRYKFRIPIDFYFEVPGESNPDLRDRFRQAITEYLHTLMRAQPNEELFDYPVEVDGRVVRMNAKVGFLGTSHAPARFRCKKVNDWYRVAQELYNRSTNHYDPPWQRDKKHLVKKADVPYYIGRHCHSIMAHLEKYKYVEFRQIEMLEHWADVYQTSNRPPSTSSSPSWKIKLKKGKKLKKRVHP